MLTGWFWHSPVVGDDCGCRRFSEPQRCHPSRGRTCFESRGSAVTVVPATVVLTLLESSPREASIGKGTRRLRVVDAVTGSLGPCPATTALLPASAMIFWAVSCGLIVEVSNHQPFADNSR